MSSLGLLLNLINELDRDAAGPSFYGNDLGLGLSPCMIQPRDVVPRSVGYSLPLSLLSRLGERHIAEREGQKEERVSTIGKDGFQVCMDVQQFKPNELNVKVVDNCIVIEGKHEEREDQHGYIERHFVRRYVLPKGYDAEKVMSTLSSDGVLTVSVPKPHIEDKSNERIIQIQQTGPAHLNVKQNSKEKIDASNGDKEEQK